MLSQGLKRFYDPTFTVTPEYKESLPDLQNGPASLINGANVPIQQVGISNFKLPLHVKQRDGKTQLLEVSVDGYVSLDANKKGINMGRIMRTFYRFKDDIFTLDTLENILKAYKKDLNAQEAFLRLNFSFPMLKNSLRSELQGYQYYEVAFEGHLDSYGRFNKFMHLNFEYSSACPCSYELAEHAREVRDLASISNSKGNRPAAQSE